MFWLRVVSDINALYCSPTIHSLTITPNYPTIRSLIITPNYPTIHSLIMTLARSHTRPAPPHSTRRRSDDWVDYDPEVYTCETLESQGCDCGGCTCHHPHWDEPSWSAEPSAKPTLVPSAAPLVHRGTCDNVEECFGYGW